MCQVLQASVFKLYMPSGRHFCVNACHLIDYIQTFGPLSVLFEQAKFYVKHLETCGRVSGCGYETVDRGQTLREWLCDVVDNIAPVCAL